MVLTADCLPIALAARRRGRRWCTRGGAAWPTACSRRACARCATSAPGRSPPRSGPCARGCCYEVGDEVRAALGARADRRARAHRPAGDRARAAPRRGRRRGPRQRAVHDVHDPARVLLPPPRRRRGPAGRRGSRGAERRRRPREPRRGPRGDRGGGAAGGPVAGRRRDRRGGQVRRGRGPRRARRGRDHGGRREPRAGARAQGRRRTRLHVGLHRPAPVAQGEACSRRSCAASTRSRATARSKELGKLDAGLEFLVEVNIAGEEGKAGHRAGRARARSSSARRTAPVGLMTMPPLAETPEDSRRWFAALRELAERARAARICRWGRPRTSPSRSRRAPRWCASAPASTACGTGAAAVIRRRARMLSAAA